MKEPGHPAFSDSCMGSSLYLEDSASELPDLAMGWWNAEGHLDQEPLGKVIFLYPAKALEWFGCSRMGLEAREMVVECSP